MKHLLFVHTAGDPRSFVSRLFDHGYRSSLVKRRPTTADYECFGCVVDLDYQEDLEGVLAWARLLHAEDPIDGVISFSESGVLGASILADQLGLPGNPPRSALRARNKYLMRRALQQAGLPVPSFRLVRDAGQIHQALRREKRPMVLKPLSGSSSYGVVRLHPDATVEEIAVHVEAVLSYIRTYRIENPQYPFEFWLPQTGYGIPKEDVCDPEADLLLEGFIGGRQVSVDGIVSRGRVSCLGFIEIERIKDTSYFMEYEEWMPTRLGEACERNIQSVVERAVHALGLVDSCFHCELKVDRDGIYVLEIAARRGADNISEFLRHLAGVDIYEEGARLAIGEYRVYPPVTYRGAMKMRYFLPLTTGILTAVEGAEEVRRDPRTRELVLEFNPGDLVLTPPHGFEFLGYLSVFAPTPSEADEALEELYTQVRFHMAPASHVMKI